MSFAGLARAPSRILCDAARRSWRSACPAPFPPPPHGFCSCAAGLDQPYYCVRLVQEETSQMNVPITFACGLYDRTLPLYTGEVKPEGIDLAYEINEEPRDIFDKMAGEQAYGASEMSASELVCRIAANQCPFVAIPIFPSRVFRHGFITIKRSGIKTPKDLEGRRIGTTVYTATAIVYIRGLLQHDYGVDLSTIKW